jgi:hypothetical protein
MKQKIVRQIAEAMRDRYNAEFNEGGELVPFAKANSKEAWLACAEAAYEILHPKAQA